MEALQRGLAGGALRAFAFLLLLGLQVTHASAADPSVASVGFVASPYVVGLNNATAMAFTPDGRIFVTQRTIGEIWVVRDGAIIARDFERLPVEGYLERGLLGIAVDPDFQSNHHVYTYYSYDAAGGLKRNRIVRLTEVAGRGEDMRIILDDIPGADHHNGGVLAFGPDGKLYVTLGDALETNRTFDHRYLNGKLLRINPDGSIPEDNPILGSPLISVGHRNVFGLAFDPVTGRPFITENGPEDSDEVNIIEPCGNYGWPRVSGFARQPAYVDPIHVFTEIVAPTNGAFYTGDKLDQTIRNDLFFGDFAHTNLHRLILDPETRSRVLHHEVVYSLDPSNLGILDVKVGLDGYIYFNTRDTIYRVTSVNVTQSSPALSYAPAMGPPFLVLMVGDVVGSGRPRGQSQTAWVWVRRQRNLILLWASVYGAIATAALLPGIGYSQGSTGQALVPSCIKYVTEECPSPFFYPLERRGCIPGYDWTWAGSFLLDFRRYAFLNAAYWGVLALISTVILQVVWRLKGRLRAAPVGRAPKEDTRQP